MRSESIDSSCCCIQQWPSVMSLLLMPLNILSISIILHLFYARSDLLAFAERNDSPDDSKPMVINRNALRLQAKEMFMHGYNSYMKFGYPDDELMPLSCSGRKRGVTAPRGDVDDALGNFSLTLVDTLDSLVVFGELEEFEKAVKVVIENVRFDSNVIVSVFETNIRMVGGLISAHVLAKLVKFKEDDRLLWYNDELLVMAEELADRLLPAFNTTTGLPHSRINLKYGMIDFLRAQRDTCTACGGTMILEFAALSRLTGKPIYEEKAKKAMDFLWGQRHRSSNLMGTVLNIYSGDWIRKDAGIGAGIDSYYEYCLKAYILLGDEDYLYRFNKHYDAIMRYVSNGPFFIDVHMHKPTVAARPFMDSLLAFWPGIQVLKGDLKSAVEFHETLHQVIKRHKFLPEAFTHDLKIHWAQHPIRPEFLESTYLLYRATKDEHYLRVAKDIMDNINSTLRVRCGFTAITDIRSMVREDRMDSFVLSETFKYLYMIFSDPADLYIDPDNYVLTTEAHFIPLSIGESSQENKLPRRLMIDPDQIIDDEDEAKRRSYRQACPNTARNHNTDDLASYIKGLRQNVQFIVGELTRRLPKDSKYIGETCSKDSSRLSAWSFSASNSDHLKQLRQMGIQMKIQADGRMQLTHTPEIASSPEWAASGIEFIQEMINLVNSMEKMELGWQSERIVQILSAPVFGTLHFKAASSQFGMDLDNNAVIAQARFAIPTRACKPLTNSASIKGKIAIVQRQECMFQEKARYVQESGAVGIIIIDDKPGSSIKASLAFAMSGEQNSYDDIVIPAVFLYNLEGAQLMEHLTRFPDALIRLSDRPENPVYLFSKHISSGYSTSKSYDSLLTADDSNGIILIDTSLKEALFNFRFGLVNVKSGMENKQRIVEENIAEMQKVYKLGFTLETTNFYNVVRRIAYWLLGLNTQPNEAELLEFSRLLPKISRVMQESLTNSPGPIKSVICRYRGKKFICERVRV